MLTQVISIQGQLESTQTKVIRVESTQNKGQIELARIKVQVKEVVRVEQVRTNVRQSKSD